MRALIFPAMRWVTSVLCVLLGGYMAVDGVHALVTGDYITASSGAYAGKLGPWALLLQSVHLDPHSLAVKLAFVVFGLIWLFHASRVYAGRVMLRPTVFLCILTFGTHRSARRSRSSSWSARCRCVRGGFLNERSRHSRHRCL